MSMEKERFRSLCLEVLPLINGIAEAVKRNGFEAIASLTTDGEDYFSFRVYDTGWNMSKISGVVNMRYEFEEKIPLQDQRLENEKMTYNKVSENLVEISLVYAGMQEKYKELGEIDSITWKQLFVDWANEFEEKYPESKYWEDSDYLECMDAFATEKICEYARIER